jgi:hypothetical protein
MLAYVFWHWRRAEAAASSYEARQRDFHAALAASPIPGFVQSLSFAPSASPIPGEDRELYEDWYAVENFAALGSINREAIAATRTAPHGAAAALAEGGTAGVYGLQQGTISASARYAHWFSKPAGMRYDGVFDELRSQIEDAGASLWMRQMVLGPAREFCVHAREPIVFPETYAVSVLELRPVWPELE